ncbi:uncharacterized protein JCM10292_006457 [Rhodotorula paludigena]|uniref:uncharacterized protein n=1 Tax=Rhodotorula paludigena TaxID=86838 RepID=UPI003176A256
MQSTRTSLQAAGKTPRRRLRPSARSHDASTTLLPPSRDLIGPPCPLSNLRPVYYAPLFPSLHSPPPAFAPSPSASSTTSPHPYSLSEFPTPRLAPTARQASLQALQLRLAQRDLAWRLHRYRLDAFNQDFWARTNARFLRARDAFLARSDAAHAAREEGRLGGEEGAFPPGASRAVGAGLGETEDVDLAPFYAQHLEATKADYARYNAALWRMQAGLVWPAIKASARKWRWKFAVWRAGGEAV